MLKIPLDNLVNYTPESIFSDSKNTIISCIMEFSVDMCIKCLGLRSFIDKPMSSGQMSFWANVFLGKCLSGQTSFWANVFWANVFLGKCLSGQMSSGQMLSGLMFFWANVFLGKCGLGKRPSGQTSHGQTSLGKFLWANVVWANVIEPFNTSGRYCSKFKTETRRCKHSQSFTLGRRFQCENSLEIPIAQNAIKPSMLII
jgi:hypothetical protein